MTNRTIAIIFVCISWALLTMSLATAIPLFIIYSVVCIFLSHIVYNRENKT